MRISSTLTRHLLLRGLRVWMLVRAGFAVALLVTLSPPLVTGGVVGVGVVALTITMGVLEALRLREMVFLANLGLRFSALLAWLAIPPLLGEILLAWFRR
jgi:hypothetical protein